MNFDTTVYKYVHTELKYNKKISYYVDIYGNTDIILYSANGKVSNLKKVLSKSKEKIDTPNYVGWTALHFAVKNNNIDIVKVLLDNDTNAICFLTKEGDAPLYMAIENNNYDIFKLLVDNCNDWSYNRIFIVMYYISQYCGPDSLKYINLVGENRIKQVINEYTGSGEYKITMFQLFCIKGHNPNTLQRLIDYGGDLSLTIYDNQQLIDAMLVHCKNIEAIKYVMQLLDIQSVDLHYNLISRADHHYIRELIKNIKFNKNISHRILPAVLSSSCKSIENNIEFYICFKCNESEYYINHRNDINDDRLIKLKLLVNNFDINFKTFVNEGGIQINFMQTFLGTTSVSPYINVDIIEYMFDVLQQKGYNVKDLILERYKDIPEFNAINFMMTRYCKNKSLDLHNAIIYMYENYGDCFLRSMYDKILKSGLYDLLYPIAIKKIKKAFSFEIIRRFILKKMVLRPGSKYIERITNFNT
jgi:ankyrin repeat protein